MSLKAKIEAVVYAAEEPVTLVQLVGLFAEEALEWKKSQAAEAASAEEPASLPASFEDLTSAAEDAADATAPNDASLKPCAPIASMTAPVAAEEAASEAAETVPMEAEMQTQPEPAETSSEPASQAAVDPAKTEEDEKRAARQKEKEIRDILRSVLDELIAEYANGDRGIEIREIAGGYRLATKPEYHDAVRSFVKKLKPPMKLSLPALETLAVIAYKQPITAPEVSEIRGADSAGVLGSLISRKLVTTAGRKQVVGRPILYKTTKDFLLRFGLKDLNELPSMEEFEKMATGALAEMDEVVPESSPGAEPSEQEEEPQTAQTAAGETNESPAEAESVAGESALEEAVLEEALAAAEDGKSSTTVQQPAAADQDFTGAEVTVESSEMETSSAATVSSEETEQVAEQEHTS